jgi:DNA-binding YbaB/EbfC family protein
MFDQLRALGSLLTQAPKIREEMEKLQGRLSTLVAEGDAGAGLVRARVNGKMQVVAIEITPSAMAINDREMLEDLIRSAVNQAIDKIRNLVKEETLKVANSLGLPSMPNLEGLLG